MPKKFQEGNFVEVLHDDEEKYIGDTGMVTEVNDLINVNVRHLGKEVPRTYFPDEIEKI